MLRERRRHANFKPNRKLDRKSSRGMIYENEELRLRTININAEVERGQSDIKKLRRENDQLRKEIWSLRDEYDRLDKLLRANKNDQRQTKRDNDRCNNNCDCCQSDDSCSTCDSCNEDNNDDICEINENNQNVQKTMSHSHVHKQPRDNLHVNFDHLSIVSEETTLTNSGGDSNAADDADDDDEEGEIVANTSGGGNGNGGACSALIDFQSIVPPLAHFENLCYEEIGPNLDSSGEIRYAPNFADCESSTTTTTGETVIPAIGWDFNAICQSAQEVVNKKQALIHSLNANQNISSGIDATSSSVQYRSPVLQPPQSPSPYIEKISFDSKSPLMKRRTGPDIFVKNGLATTTTASNRSIPLTIKSYDPIYARVQKGAISPSCFPTGGNLDDLLLDIEHLSNDILQLQLENQKYHSQCNLNSPIDKDMVDSVMNGKNRPAYRSEMNLLLSFDGGSVPTITTVPFANQQQQQQQQQLKSDKFSSSLDLKTPPPSPTSPSPSVDIVIPEPLYSLPNKLQDTPPPTLPKPMPLLPTTLPYIEFKDTRLPISELNANAECLVDSTNAMTSSNSLQVVQKETNLASIRRRLFSRKSSIMPIMNSSINKSSQPLPPSSISQIPCLSSSPQSLILQSLPPPPPPPLPPPLFIENQSQKLSKMSPKMDKRHAAEAHSSSSEPPVIEPSSKADVKQRKSRRVSIYFNGSKKNQDNKSNKQKTGVITNGGSGGGGVGSNNNTQVINVQSPDGNDGNHQHTTTSSSSGGTSVLPSASQLKKSHQHQHQHHHHRKMSQDSTPITRYKKPRRHSDVAGGSSIGYGNDETTGGGTSLSERNSNSLASSRESSASLSMRSQKSRKISIGSHGGGVGKIPWCACWGI